MRIILYFINWNDSFYLPFIKEHYGAFCEKIIMYDNYSDDNSVLLAQQLGFEVRYFGWRGMLNDQAYIDVKNHCWKECRGLNVDYVIVCDADEFLCQSLQFRKTVLRHTGRPTAPIVKGWNIVSEEMPKESLFEINTGSYSENYGKQAIFNPDAIKEINFVHGCHANRMSGAVTTYGMSWNLVHFRQIGGIQRMLDRHAEYRPRLSKFNLQYNMGHHYGRPDWTAEKIAEFNEDKKREWYQLKSEAIALW